MKSLMTAFAVVLFFNTSSFAAKQLQVKGSDTEVNVVQLLAEKYMSKNKNVSISVTGGGSGTGIAALFNKTTDLANSSREMKPDELSKAKNSGLNPKHIIFATDALTVIVNSENKLKSLTLEQVSKLFKGEIKNWKELGGGDRPVSLYGRQSNSGTFTFFRDMVVKADYSPEMKGMNGNSQIVEAVAQDKGAVGFVGVAYAKSKGISILSISKSANEKPVNPLDEKSVINGRYPIARPLYQYFVESSPELLGFLKYEAGPEGRKIINSEGFYDIKPQWKSENSKVLE